ncbi:uncharacterized protein LOC133289389 [Gastrolobium bilobum]|uniref:uncharacterized protein LOC133289389 n=1 Tax=Gastrolobium bilobum TaxID=150636 RepID=UPI002AB26728|nr:uncharacterized protein LOC133289389 [Gastrolobium bilobum]
MANLPEFLTNSSHPLFLHSNENPSQVLVTPLLNGRNYHSWARSMSMALRSKNKLGFVNGVVEVPDPDSAEYETWERCNTTVLGWIHRSISQTIAQSINDAWNDLRNRFSQSDIFRISDLQEEIQKLHQGDKTMTEFFTQLKILWDELENLKPIPTPLVACVCGTADVMRTYRDQDHTIRFLKVLNDTYSQVRSQVILIEPLPNVIKAFSLITQQERQFYSEDQLNARTTAQTFAAVTDHSNNRRGAYNGGGYNRAPSGNYGGSSGNYGGRSIRGRGRGFGGRNTPGRLCTHCNRSNHTIETCYLLHGFPPGYKTYNSHMANNISTSDLENNAAFQDPDNRVSSIDMIQGQYEKILNL